MISKLFYSDVVINEIKNDRGTRVKKVKLNHPFRCKNSAFQRELCEYVLEKMSKGRKSFYADRWASTQTTQVRWQAHLEHLSSFFLSYFFLLLLLIKGILHQLHVHKSRYLLYTLPTLHSRGVLFDVNGKNYRII